MPVIVAAVWDLRSLRSSSQWATSGSSRDSTARPAAVQYSGRRMPTGMFTNISLCVAKRATYTMSQPSGSARLQVSWQLRLSE